MVKHKRKKPMKKKRGIYYWLDVIDRWVTAAAIVAFGAGCAMVGAILAEYLGLI
jgi:hypothetical protein